MTKQNWEKDFDKKFSVVPNEVNSLIFFIKPSPPDIKYFIRQLLEKRDKEHLELTKRLVQKKNKDCRRYLREQKEEIKKVVEETTEIYQLRGKKWIKLGWGVKKDILKAIAKL